MANRAPSTRKILEQSIQDIKDGLWTCDILTRDCEVVPGGCSKPMGCALGLVGINAGQARIEEYEGFDGLCRITAVLDYPSEADAMNDPWPRSALRAVELLASTTRLSKMRREELSDPYNLDRLEQSAAYVTGYNDTGAHGEAPLTPRQAIAWFRRALAELDK